MTEFRNPPQRIEERLFYHPKSSEFKIMKEMVIKEFLSSVTNQFCKKHHSIETRNSIPRHIECGGLITKGVVTSKIFCHISCKELTYEDSWTTFIDIIEKTCKTDDGSIKAIYFEKYETHAQKIQATKSFKKVKTEDDFKIDPNYIKVDLGIKSNNALNEEEVKSNISPIKLNPNIIPPQPELRNENIEPRKLVNIPSKRKFEEEEIQLLIDSIIDLKIATKQRFDEVEKRLSQIVNSVSGLYKMLHNTKKETATNKKTASADNEQGDRNPIKVLNEKEKNHDVDAKEEKRAENKEKPKVGRKPKNLEQKVNY
jgi:hypothetical protein